MDDKPPVFCIVGYETAAGCTESRTLLTLDEAEQLAKLGWTVMVDPWGLESVTRWEQIERAHRGKGPRVTW